MSIFDNMEKTNGFMKTLERIRQQKRAARKLQEMRVQSGWIDGTRTTGSNTPFAVIARTLNYGREPLVTRKGWTAPEIPARNFMKQCTDKFSSPALAEASKALSLVFRSGMEYRADIGRALQPVAERLSGCLKTAIVRGEYRKNARATILPWAKRHANSSKAMRQANRLKGEARVQALSANKQPLVDTGELVQAVKGRVL